MIHKVRTAIGGVFLAVVAIALVVMLFVPNTYATRREFQRYFVATLAEGSRNLPDKGFSLGPKTVWMSYEEQASSSLYVGMDGDPAMSYTEVYFADGGRFLGYYQRLSTGSSYGDGFTPEIAAYTEITAAEFHDHVPLAP